MNSSYYAILGFVAGSSILWGYAILIYVSSRKINRRYERMEKSK